MVVETARERSALLPEVHAEADAEADAHAGADAEADATEKAKAHEEVDAKAEDSVQVSGGDLPFSAEVPGDRTWRRWHPVGFLRTESTVGSSLSSEKD